MIGDIEAASVAVAFAMVVSAAIMGISLVIAARIMRGRKGPE